MEGESAPVRPAATSAAAVEAKEETPTEVRSSGRKRKAVEVPNIGKTSDEKKVVIPDGTGKPLGEIGPIKEALDAFRGCDDVLKGLHRLLFGIPGKHLHVKRHVRAFKGFAKFSSEKEENKAKSKLDTWTTAGLKDLAEIFQLPNTGTKEEKIDRIWQFIKEPKDVKAKKGTKPPKSKEARAKKTAPKKKDDEEEEEEDEDELAEPEEESKRPAAKKAKNGEPRAKKAKADDLSAEKVADSDEEKAQE